MIYNKKLNKKKITKSNIMRIYIKKNHNANLII